MAAKRTTSDPSKVINPSTKHQIAQAVDELLDKHAQEIADAIEESEAKKLPVNLVVEFSCANSQPEIKVSLRFTPKTVTDSRVIVCDDPAQGGFEIMTPLALAERAKQRANDARRQAEDEASEGSGEPAPDKPKGKRGRKAKATGEEGD